MSGCRAFHRVRYSGRQVCDSLFAKDKLMLSLLLTFKSMEAGILAPAKIYEHLKCVSKVLWKFGCAHLLSFSHETQLGIVSKQPGGQWSWLVRQVDSELDQAEKSLLLVGGTTGAEVGLPLVNVSHQRLQVRNRALRLNFKQLLKTSRNS